MIRVRLRPRAWVLLPLSLSSAFAFVAAAILPADVHAAAAEPGGAGTDTSLPLTPSAVTAQGRGDFAGLSITVNQTQDLTNQAVSIVWSGAAPTLGGDRPDGNFLQIMQCWGEDDGTVPGNPGPPPEQCQQGAQVRSGIPATWPGGDAPSRIIDHVQPGAPPPATGFLETATGRVWRPFRAVDGDVVDVQYDDRFNPQLGGGNWWKNTKFDVYKTNEVYAARTAADGTGAQLFEVQTGREADGLGCGQSVEPVAGGQTRIPKCWLVIVPRGTAEAENAGSVWEGQPVPVSTSPVAPDAWANRIAIELQFTPLASACSIGQSERRVVGSELALPAIDRWKPVLCAEGAPPYAYSPVADDQARQQIANPVAGAPGMAVVSAPLAPERERADQPLVYAPLSLTGVVVGFNLERVVHFSAPEAEQPLAGVPVAEINLTPRLVAKLLTESYRSQFPGNVVPTESVGGYDWLADNPSDIVRDPDFLRFNPEFTMLNNSGRTLGGFLAPAGGSDAARLVWDWVFADPEAAAWLGGAEDEWKMRVNPWYTTNADAHPLGLAFGSPRPNSFVRNEPACFQAPPFGQNLTPPRLCSGDWMPFARSYGEAARATRLASTGAKVEPDPLAVDATRYWRPEVPQSPGQRGIVSITDAASAAQYGLQTARLSRAGDGGDVREFVAADTAGLTKGVDAMTTRAREDVLEPVVDGQHPGAYPLTTLLHAVVAPYALDDAAKDEYATLIEYGAVGPGQEPGLRPGQLPAGYAPLPTALQQHAALVSLVIRNAERPPAPPPTTTTTTTTTTTSPPPTTVAATTTTTTATTSSSTTTTTRPRRSGSATTVPPRTTTTRPPATTAGPTTTTSPAAAPPTTAPAAPVDTEEPPPDEVTPATPFQALGRNRYAVPGLGAIALSSGLGALEITKRPRRGLPPDRPLGPPPGGGA